jgi:hypothetical protein
MYISICTLVVLESYTNLLDHVIFIDEQSKDPYKSTVTRSKQFLVMPHTITLSDNL